MRQRLAVAVHGSQGVMVVPAGAADGSTSPASEPGMSEPDSWGMTDATITMRDRYLGAMEFEEMLATATKNQDLWAAVWRRAEVPDEVVRRLAATGGARHFLGLSGGWCGGAVNTLPLGGRLPPPAGHPPPRGLGPGF